MLKRTRPLFTQSYGKTLSLPRSTFPPRPDIALRPTLLKQCTDDLYGWQSSNRPAENTFTLHDGPPYANGPLHIGHALNKVLKDVFNRFQCSQGWRVNYRPGWDCHGLPIELKALQSSQAGDTRPQIKDAVAVRQAARDLARHAIEEQKKEFKSWGVMGDWHNAYMSMDAGFEIPQLHVFKEMVRKGLIYRRNKPVYWSPSSGTALAEAELEYNEQHVSPAAYVRFKLNDIPEKLQQWAATSNLYLLIWTTTPWTLVANRAIAFHDGMDYSLIQMASGDCTIAATSRVEEVLKAAGLSFRTVKVVAEIKGQDLYGASYENPLRGDAPAQPLLHADFVSSETGSGLVHVAPGHGFDDYHLCQSMSIEPFAPVDDSGCFTASPGVPGHIQGISVLERGSESVLDLLEAEDRSSVWARHEYTHKYPIDWRTKLPVIIRATPQWFANVDEIKERALAALEEVGFVPNSGKLRLQSFVKDRSHWCISRQRAWGVPIPALFRTDEHGHQEAIMTDASILHILEVIKERGTDSWWTDPQDDPRWIAPDLPSGSYIRGKDTMDVWFDSGTTWTQIDGNAAVEAPATVYLEGTDQHRGWFQSSLLTRTAFYADKWRDGLVAAPFKRLITHGFVLDQQGRKMSKSVGNVVSPEQIMDGSLLPPLKPNKKQKQNSSREAVKADGVLEKHVFDAMGPDALRLWAASSDYTSDISVGTSGLSAVQTSLHKYRVTIKWLLGVLSDYTAASPTFTTVASKTADPLAKTIESDLSDRLALQALAKTTQQVHAHYMAYEPHKALTILSRYTTNSLSAFYFETAKDILYTAPLADRASVQAVCYTIFHHLLAMLAPVTPLMVQETLHYAPTGLRECLEQRRHEPFRNIWEPLHIIENSTVPNPDAKTPHQEIMRKAQLIPVASESRFIHIIRTAVRSAQERARSGKWQLGSGLDCDVQLVLPMSTSEVLRKFVQNICGSGELARALVVSRASSSWVGPAKEDIVIDDHRKGMTRDSAVVISEDFSVNLKLGDAAADDDGDGEREIMVKGSVLILRPVDEKCLRCWRFVMPALEITVSRWDKPSDVCSRCSRALMERGDVKA